MQAVSYPDMLDESSVDYVKKFRDLAKKMGNEQDSSSSDNGESRSTINFSSLLSKAAKLVAMLCFKNVAILTFLIGIVADVKFSIFTTRLLQIASFQKIVLFVFLGTKVIMKEKYWKTVKKKSVYYRKCVKLQSTIAFTEVMFKSF